MKIFFACDHAGLILKEAMIAYAKEQGHETIDLGTHKGDSVDYPDFAEKCVVEVLRDPASFGVLTCGTGIGMSIAANRFKGIRAAVCNNSLESVRLSRAHNHANILCLGGRLVDAAFATEALGIFLNTPEENDRHTRRVKKLDLIC